MTRRFHLLAMGLLLGVLSIGCGKKSGAAHEHAQHAEPAGHKEAPEHAEHNDHAGHGEEDEEENGVTFKEGRGLQLTPEIVKALTLTVEPVVQRSLSPVWELTAQVFATAPQVLASARVPVDRVAAIEDAPFHAAKLLRIDRSAASATRFIDAIFQLESPDAVAVGDFVTVSLALAPRSLLSVSRSSLLDTATGTYVYVANGDFYLRTSVTTGLHSTDAVEITAGLAVGQRVVVSPVEQLWLAELRLTKGGGHSH